MHCGLMATTALKRMQHMHSDSLDLEVSSTQPCVVTELPRGGPEPAGCMLPKNETLQTASKVITVRCLAELLHLQHQACSADAESPPSSARFPLSPSFIICCWFVSYLWFRDSVLLASSFLSVPVNVFARPLSARSWFLGSVIISYNIYSRP